MSRSLAFLLSLVLVALAASFLLSQEVPLGSLRGQVLAEETGRPLAHALVTLSPVGEMAASQRFTAAEDGRFAAGRLPAGAYLLSASSKAHELKSVPVQIEEGRTRALTLELAPKPPFFEVRTPQPVFTPEEAPRVIAHGFLRGNEIEARFYRVDLDYLLREQEGNLYSLLHPAGPWGSRREPRLEDNPHLEARGEARLPITGRDAEGVFQQRLTLPIREPGLYLVSLKGDEIRQLTWVMVTRLALITKSSPDSFLSYVADIRTGRPVPGASLEARVGESVAASGASDENGLFQAQLPEKRDGGRLTVVASKEGSLAFTSQWLGYGGGEGNHRVYLYTDRPVYRPGHEVYYKGIVRRLQGDEYQVPADLPVEVEVRDERTQSLAYRASSRTNSFGSFDGKLKLSPEAPTGEYTVAIRLGEEEHHGGFEVAEYRKPEFSVEVKPARGRYVLGETATVKVAAEYYFGAPAAGCEVQYSVYRSPFWFYPGEEYEDYEYFGEEEYGYGWELLEEGTARTDANGRAVLRLPTGPRETAHEEGLPEEETEELSHDWDYSLEVTVTDPSRKSTSGEGSFRVTRGEFAVFVDMKTFSCRPGERAEGEIVAIGYDRKPRARVPLEVVAGAQTWVGREVKFAPEVRKRLMTDAGGKARFSFSPRREGSYRLRAAARDRRGNLIQDRGYLWVTASPYADFSYPYGELDLVADKKTYREGEEVRLLINSEYKGGLALLTIEGPRLYEHRLVELRGKSTAVSLRVRPAYLPNFFVSVSLVKDKKFAFRTIGLRVSSKAKALKLEVKSDRTQYQPGETARYHIKATDGAGKPVRAEVSLGVVDESIYAIREERKPDILGAFYPTRYNQVETDYSFPAFYLDGGKEGAGIKVRRRFPDTALWLPALVTDERGEAEARLQVPDTLTTWRATARAHTAETLVGSATNKMVCRKEFLVRLEAPRFFTQKDRLLLAAVVHNYTGEAQKAKVGLKTPGHRLLTPAEQEVSLPPNSLKRVDWQIEAKEAGSHEVMVYAKAERGPGDAMALTLPTLPHGRERIEWRVGLVRSQATERLLLREDAVPGAGLVRVRLAPSLISLAFGSLEYLASYPYGCTEQTMSSFLPDVLLARYLKELGLSNPRLERELPDMVQKGLLRLYSFQQEDGGWGWWRYDESDPWMTAYVIFGLLNAKAAGFEVNPALLQRGLHRLRAALQKPLAPEVEAFALYALSLAGREPVVLQRLHKLSLRLSSLSSQQLAFLSLAQAEAGLAPQAKAALDELWRRASDRGQLLFWEASEGWGRHGGETELTALALKACLRVDPQDSRVPKIIRWLLSRRQGNHWLSTRDTAFILFALVDFLRQTKELQPDYQAVVRWNDEEVSRLHFGGESVLQPEVEVRLPAAKIRRGENFLRLDKEGPGNLYYSVIFQQFVGEEELAATVSGAGITISREYYKISPVRQEKTGLLVTRAAERPGDRFQAKQPVLVRLKVRAPRDFEYVLIEDPLPAGCEVADAGKVDRSEWRNWWADQEVRDEKVTFFARRLPRGESTLEYHLRPEIPGDYHVMPTEIYAMYEPEIRASGPESRLRIRE
jgi:hypothetical protein